MNSSSSRPDCARNDQRPGERWWPPRLLSAPDGSVLVLIPAGEFFMGSTAEQIAAAAAMDIGGHPDLLVRETPPFVAFLPDYYLGLHAVTNAQFAAFLNATRPPPARLARWAPALERILPPPSPDRRFEVAAGFERHPATHISWFGAQAYCRWAGLRLPTELEWEKAARGTEGRVFPWGNEWRAHALRWHGGDRREGETTAPVDAYPEGCSPYGLLQMAGNVDEWCSDWFQWDVYRHYAAGDLRPPVPGEERVIRGGTCLRWQRHHFRCAMRRGNDPAMVNVHYTGIRCAADVSARSPAFREAPEA